MFDWQTFDWQTWCFIGGVFAVLTAATAVGRLLRRRSDPGLDVDIIQAFNRRVRGWWLLCVLVAIALVFHKYPWVAVVLFGLISFWALREFVTLTPTRMGDHRALFWVFICLTPLQYVLVGMGHEYYGLYSILIPVYGVLFVAARIAFSGDHKHFLERVAKIQAGLIVCVYCLSFAPALLYLDLAENELIAARDPSARIRAENTDGPAAETPPEPAAGPRREPWTRPNGLLLLFLVFMVEVSEATQFVCGRLFGKRVIAPEISQTRTWEGLLGGMIVCGVLGGLLCWATPFNYWQAACMSAIVALLGFAGGMTMAAIKRDRGVKDYGTLIAGHGGVLDRIDALCFAAPVFFHLTRYWFTLPP